MNKFWRLMYSIMIIVNNTVAFKVAKRIDLKCSHHQKEMIIM